MKRPNQFELAHAAEVCMRLADYIEENNLSTEYDLYLLGGAANTIDEFIENEELTFFEEIPNGNRKTKKTTAPTPDSKTDINDYHYDPDRH